MFFSKTIYSDNGVPTEVELICNKCGKYISITELNIFERIQADYCITTKEGDIICSCGNHSQSGLIEYRNNEQIKLKSSQTVSKAPKCPKCGSTSITAVNKKWSPLTGFLTTKTDRFCLNCKHKW